MEYWNIKKQAEIVIFKIYRSLHETYMNIYENDVCLLTYIFVNL